MVLWWCMTIRKTHHTTYDTKYHLVWTPKRRRHVRDENVRKVIEEAIKEIAANHNMEIDELEMSEDHVHVFLSFPPRYSISWVVGLLKSVSSSIAQKQFPELLEQLRLYRTNLWERGFFVRTVGDKVTAEIIKNYIKYHRTDEVNPNQPKLF